MKNDSEVGRSNDLNASAVPQIEIQSSKRVSEVTSNP